MVKGIVSIYLSAFQIAASIIQENGGKKKKLGF